tara:strand:+ start:166 stop:504 length:339 start_codon:yes stop_codon:yes gene_type:complete
MILKFISTHKKKAIKMKKESDKESAKLEKMEMKKKAKIEKIEAKEALKKAEKEAKKATQIKRKPTAFANYMKKERSTVKSNNPDASFGDISKIVGSNWKKLSDEEKLQYKLE